MRLKSAIGHDDNHTKLLINAGQCFRSLLYKLNSKLISHGFLPQSLLLGKKRPIVKRSAGNKTSLSKYRPVMISSSLLELFEYLNLPCLETYLNLSHTQFSCRSFNHECLERVNLPNFLAS